MGVGSFVMRVARARRQARRRLRALLRTALGSKWFGKRIEVWTQTSGVWVRAGSESELGFGHELQDFKERLAN